ncbi:tetratricopeptide repeat protein [Actinomadura sp. NTSP31]|uniref:tetratricopeptide repeat protein n=1 Tax=Actinomadura sp. NTSP31 TaxID=1735447 RepID=UPI0035C01880
MDALLGDSLRGGAPLVIVLQGMPGVGKTALAVQWAHTVAPCFSDGQLFLDLRGHSADAAMEPREALDRLLRGLGVPGELVPAEVEAQIALLRSHFARRAMLLVLDNAAGSDQVHPLLASGPRCVTVVTSRKRLPGLIVTSGVHTLDLKVLRPEEAFEVVAAVLGQDEASAQPAAVSDLTEQCDYLPLALRLAAANQRVRPHSTVADVVRELSEGNRLSALALDDDLSSSAVRMAFDFSYRELTLEQKRGFCLLGLVAGTEFGPDAVTALLGRDAATTRQILRGLALANLIEQPAPGRFRLHDLLADYACERLRSEELTQQRTAARRRLQDWLLDTAQDMAQAIRPRSRSGACPRPPSLENALDWYERERRLLVATTRQAALNGSRKITWQLAEALFTFLDLRAYTLENLEVHQYGAEAAELAEDDVALATMLRHLTCIYREQGRYGKAIRVGERARALFVAREEQWAVAESMATLASVYWRCSDYDQVRQLIHGALLIRQRLGDRRGEADCLNDLARIHRRLGHCTDALRCDLEALDLRQELTDRYGEARSFLNLSRVYCRMGLHGRALEAAESAMAICEQLGAQKDKALALCSMANVLRHLGRPEEAEEPATEALFIQIRVGDSRGETATRDNLARIRLALGDVEGALEHARLALSIDMQLSDPYGIALRRHTLGQIKASAHDHEAAMGDFEAELVLRQEIGDVRGTATTFIAMASLWEDMGRGGKAIEYAERAVAIERRYDNAFALGRRLAHAGSVVARYQGIRAARPYWEEACGLLADVDPSAVLVMHGRLGAA